MEANWSFLSSSWGSSDSWVLNIKLAPSSSSCCTFSDATSGRKRVSNEILSDWGSLWKGLLAKEAAPNVNQHLQNRSLKCWCIEPRNVRAWKNSVLLTQSSLFQPIPHKWYSKSPPFSSLFGFVSLKQVKALPCLINGVVAVERKWLPNTVD